MPLIHIDAVSNIISFDCQILKQKIALLETSNADLQKQLQEHQVNFEHLTKQAVDAQVSCTMSFSLQLLYCLNL